MTAVAFDIDPYLLPLPTPASPVIGEDLIVGASTRAGAVFGDAVWPLDLLTANPSAHRQAINWSSCPSAFAGELRLAAWNLINGRLRPVFVKDRKDNLRPRLSVGALHYTVSLWMDMATWLTGQGISTLAACDGDVLDAYAAHLVDVDTSRGEVKKTLGALTRLWAFDQMSAAPSGIGKPRWEDVGIDDYLPAETSVGGENATEPLEEATMGPLLVWAMRVVDDFADDILAGWSEYQRLVQAAGIDIDAQARRAVLKDFLDPLIAEGTPLPAVRGTGGMRLARTYIAGRLGVPVHQVNRYVKHHPAFAGRGVNGPLEQWGPCPMDVAIKGRIGGRPWSSAIDFDEAADLMRHLGTAAFIVMAYLTGMRPGEILGLRTGCCPDPEPGPDGRTGRHLIRGNEYKTAFDEDGSHLSTGIERDVPWIAITPVVNAIRVLERMVPSGALLFDTAAHDLPFGRQRMGAIKTSALAARTERFAAWANKLAANHGLDREVIPPDPHGPVGTIRYRRTLAWHIARRPGGLVALAVQYGHMRTVVSNSYAVRSRNGIHALLDLETVRAVADTVAHLRDDLEAGGGISGPAARHAIRTAVSGPFFAGAVINATTARRLVANEDIMLYENPNAFLLCRYRREQALCHRDGATDSPSLDRCVPACGNIVRTDQHAQQLRARADVVELRATHAPGPVGDRLRGTAGKLRVYADRHDSTRITLAEATA